MRVAQADMTTSPRFRASRIFVSLVLIALVGCDEQKQTRAQPPQAVKTIEVAAVNASVARSLAGVLVVAEETRLSFPIGGKLAEATLREGEAFEAGQIIAQLDQADFQRDVSAQKARLAAVESRLKEANEEFIRQETLLAKGAATKVALARAESAREIARADRRVAEVAVATAEENLRRTILRAPRSGVVTKLLAKQFEEIAAGQPVYEVGARDALEVLVRVPEHLVPLLRYDAPVDVTIPGLSDRLVIGKIIEIAATAEAGNAFRVRARLDETPSGARSGMSANVRLLIPGTDAADKITFPVPLSALAFDKIETGPVVGRKGTLFVFDPAAQVLRRKDVSIAGVVGNRVFVTEGLSTGERVVTAGVAFLQDGQRARLWRPAE